MTQLSKLSIEVMKLEVRAEVLDVILASAKDQQGALTDFGCVIANILYHSGHSIAEIANLIGVNNSTIKSSL